MSRTILFAASLILSLIFALHFSRPRVDAEWQD